MIISRARTSRALSSLVAIVALTTVVAACGSDSSDGSPVSDSTLPPVSAGFTHPTGADEVVIEYSEVGGFVPVEVSFQQAPNVLVSGDGQVFTPGMVPAIFPGPLVMPINVQTISEAGIQQILAAAEESGLLADVTYDTPTQIADASTARVVINVDGETYVHEAYALGFEPSGEEVSPERQALAEFVQELQVLGMVDVGALGESAVFDADEYGIRAMSIDDLAAYGDDGIEPVVVAWPTESGVALADATECVIVPAKAVASTFAEATQITFFDDGGTTYQVLVKPILPGTAC